MSNNEVEVGFSGNINTMLGIALVTAAISLALSVWGLSRINDLEAFVAVQAIRSAQEARK
jgi:cytochrome oxidase assembly protein ShyY1